MERRCQDAVDDQDWEEPRNLRRAVWLNDHAEGWLKAGECHI
jgi:hypothetical protein